MAAPLNPASRANCIEAAARWLYDNPGHLRPTIPILADKFSLTPREPIEAIRRSRDLWAEAVREAAEHKEK